MKDKLMRIFMVTLAIFDQNIETLKHKIVAYRLKHVTLPDEYRRLKQQMIYLVNKHVSDQQGYSNLIHHITLYGSQWESIIQYYIDFEFQHETKSKLFWENQKIDRQLKPIFLRNLNVRLNIINESLESPYMRIYSSSGSYRKGKFTQVVLDPSRKALTFIKTYEVKQERHRVLA